MAKSQKIKRMTTKIATLNNIIKELKDKLIINQDVSNILENSTENANNLFNRMLNKKTTQKYSPQLRTFAMTLHFHSPIAYQYVRKTFSKCLPHPKRLQKWYQSVSGEPVFTTEALTVLGKLAQGTPIPCCLMLDEMAIRQQVQCSMDECMGKFYPVNLEVL